MATTKTTTEASSRRVAYGAGLSNGLQVASAVYQLHSSPTTNDVIEMVKLPAGANLVDLVVQAATLDSGASFTFNVGDGGSTSRFVSGSTVGQSAGTQRLNQAQVVPHQYTAEDTIDIKIGTSPATTQTNNISLTAYYFYDPNFSTS